MKTFHLEIITPEKISVSEAVAMLEAPSKDGYIGILPNHMPLFTRLIEGEIKITTEKGEDYLAVGSGFLEINNNKAIILVTSAYKAEELNETELLQAKKRAELALLEKPQGDARLFAEAQFRRSELALKVLKRHRTRL